LANIIKQIVNAYLLNIDLSFKPEIFLKRYISSLLLVYVNRRYLNPLKTDLSPAELYNIIVINPNTLLLIRYKAFNKSKKSFLNVFINKRSLYPRNRLIYIKLIN
jgi:hypothetical protein